MCLWGFHGNEATTLHRACNGEAVGPGRGGGARSWRISHSSAKPGGAAAAADASLGVWSPELPLLLSADASMSDPIPAQAAL